MTVNHVPIDHVQSSHIQAVHIDALREKIKSSLEKAQVQRSTIKRYNSNYATLSVIFSAIAACLAGIAGSLGEGVMWTGICLFACFNRFYLLARTSVQGGSGNDS
jgi:hypothetical protein